MPRVYRQGAAPPGPPSPLQKRGIARQWYAPDARDFIRVLRWRAQAGEIYAARGAGDRADILARSMGAGPDRWVRPYTYPADGLLAMRDAGLLAMSRVDEVPGLDPGVLMKTAADRLQYGGDIEFWRVEVPASREPVRYPNQRPYRGPH